MRILKISSILLLLVSSSLFVSCDQQDQVPPVGEPQQRRGDAAYREAVLQFEKGYCSEDPVQAESALIHFRDQMLKMRQREEKPRYNFDFILGMVNARLACLYLAQNRKDELGLYFSQATNHIAKSAIAKGQAPVMLTPAELCAVVKQGDSLMNVKWKKKYSDFQQDNSIPIRE